MLIGVTLEDIDFFVDNIQLVPQISLQIFKFAIRNPITNIFTCIIALGVWVWFIILFALDFFELLVESDDVVFCWS